MQEAFNSLNNIPNKNRIKNNKQIGINQKDKILNNNNFSIDNIKDNNNEEENVNLGISYSKITEPDIVVNNKTNINNINEENHNQGLITPNTSIYNLSETITKKSEQINDNKDNINIKLKLDNKKINNDFLFEEDSLLNIQKFNNSLEEFNTNKTGKENKINNS